MSTLGILLFNPLLPVWVMAVCLLVFGVLCWLTYAKCTLSMLQKLFLLALRLAAFGIICWLMVQPVQRSLEVMEEKPSMAVVVDTSASMEDVLPGVAKNRAAVAEELLASSEMARLRRQFNVQLFSMGEELRRLDGDGREYSDGQSRLFTGLQRMRAETKADRPVAALVFTDGLDTSGLGMEGLVLDVPLIIPELELASEIKEDTSSEFSVALADSNGPRRVVKGWKTSVRINVNRLRGKGAVTVPVALFQGTTEQEIHEVEFSEDTRYAQTSFELTPQEEGMYSYRVEIRPPADGDKENNRGEFVLEVTDEISRVLYLEGLVRQDFKFLKRALLKEKGFQSSVYVRMGAGIFVNFEDSDDPRNELGKLLTDENLKRYKVLILGEFTGDAMSREQVSAVTRFVERGGGLLLAGASRAYGNGGYLGKEQFGALSPVVCQTDARMQEGKAFPMNFTAAGRNDSTFMKLAADAMFSPLQSIWGPVKPVEGAMVFLETGDGQPVLATRRYGEGRVCILLSNTLYTLRLHGGATDGISFYDQFVSQIMFWMLPDAKKDAEADSLQLLVKGDSAELNQTVAVGALSGRKEQAGALQCQVTSPDGKTVTLPMQETTLSGQVGLSSSKAGFLSEFKASQAGTYALEIVRNDGFKSDKKLLVVRRPVLEMTGKPVNRDLLKKLAAESKGHFLPYGQFSDILKGLRITARNREIVHEETQWDSWWWLMPLMGLFCLEWFLRRRWDMV